MPAYSPLKLEQGRLDGGSNRRSGGCCITMPPVQLEMIYSGNRYLALLRYTSRKVTGSEGTERATGGDLVAHSATKLGINRSICGHVAKYPPGFGKLEHPKRRPGTTGYLKLCSSKHSPNWMTEYMYGTYLRCSHYRRQPPWMLVLGHLYCELNNYV